MKKNVLYLSLIVIAIFLLGCSNSSNGKGGGGDDDDDYDGDLEQAELTVLNYPEGANLSGLVYYSRTEPINQFDYVYMTGVDSNFATILTIPIGSGSPLSISTLKPEDLFGDRLITLHAPGVYPPDMRCAVVLFDSNGCGTVDWDLMTKTADLPWEG